MSTATKKKTRASSGRLFAKLEGLGEASNVLACATAPSRASAASLRSAEQLVGAGLPFTRPGSVDRLASKLDRLVSAAASMPKR